MNSEDVAKLPYPGTYSPSMINFSTDGKILSFLDAEQGQLGRQLWGVSLATLEKTQLLTPPHGGDTEENLTKEEILRRERQRSFALGVTSYSWASKSEIPRLMVPLQGSIYIMDQGDENLRLIYNKDALGSAAIDPQISPDGQWVAFVVDRELYVVSAEGDATQIPKKLTEGCLEDPCLSHALADFLAQEEMDRYHGFWWSLDSKSIAFTEVDEKDLFSYRIVHQGKDQVGEETQEEHRYPFAGGPNPKTKLAVITLPGPEVSQVKYDPVWMDIWPESEGEFYLARVHWFPDGSVAVQVVNREQSILRLLRCCPTSGASQMLVEEQSGAWINIHNMFSCLSEPVLPGDSMQDSQEVRDFSFLWASERSGFSHLYLYTYTASDSTVTLIRQVTAGDWIVDGIVGTNQDKNLVFFSGTLDSPIEKHLYVTELLLSESSAPTRPTRLTPEGGFYNCVMDRNATRLVTVGSSAASPPKMVLWEIPDTPLTTPPTVLTELYSGEADPRVSSLQKFLVPPQFVSFQSRDSQATLHAAIYKPDDTKHGPPPYPTIVHVYGGPHVQRVQNAWQSTVDMRAQRMRDLGFLIVKCDNRGSSRRGISFESPIKHNMGSIEILDQEDAVSFAVGLGLADLGRVGIYGWSYGGYMSAMALCKAPHIFKVGVAGAPVTSWDGYDTCYTERYMGTPTSNPSGYEQSSVLHHATKMEGKLMLVHGLIDENVHFRHTARLVNALIAARKYYDFLLFPDERHFPRKLQDRIYMEQRISDYFVQHLMKDSFKSASNL